MNGVKFCALCYIGMRFNLSFCLGQRCGIQCPKKKSTKYQHTASIVHAIFKTDLLASYSNIMAYDNSNFLMYVMFYTTIIININFIKVFTYDKLNYGLKIHIGTDCY